MNDSTPPVRQLLEETLAHEDQRMTDLEHRVESLRESRRTPRADVSGVLPGSILEEAASLRELSVDEDAGVAEGLDVIDDEEVEAARLLLAQSGQQLRKVEEQLARLEAEPRDAEDGFRAASPVPTAEEVAPPPTRYDEQVRIDFPRQGYRTQEIKVPKHALESGGTPGRQTRVVVPHDTERYELNSAFGGQSELAKLAAGQERILGRLEVLEARMRGAGPSEEASARVERVEARIEQLETVCREMLRATRERSRQTHALGEALATLRAELHASRAAARPSPASAAAAPPASPLSASSHGRRLIARIRSGEYRRPGSVDVDAIRAELHRMGEEHQTLVQAHADLLERLLDLIG